MPKGVTTSGPFMVISPFGTWMALVYPIRLRHSKRWLEKADCARSARVKLGRPGAKGKSSGKPQDAMPRAKGRREPAPTQPVSEPASDASERGKSQSAVPPPVPRFSHKAPSAPQPRA